MFSIARTAVCSRPFVAANARRYASTSGSAPTPKSSSSSKTGLWLAGAGAAGLAAYYFTQGSGASAQSGPKKPLSSPLDPQKFIDLPLKRVEPYNHNTAKYVFDLGPDQAGLLPVASCVYLRSEDPKAQSLNDGKPVQRPYTPISPPDLPGELVFLIKKYDTGKMTPYIAQMQPGEKLLIKGPLPKIKYNINEYDNVGMIAGGSGITPMYQILHYALADPTNKTKFKLIFANVTEKDILLKDEFDALKKKYPESFDVVYTVDQPGASWKGPTGYINAPLVKAHFAPPTDGEKVKIFVCGPPGQVKAVSGPKASIKDQGPLSGVLKELGYNEDQVFKF